MFETLILQLTLSVADMTELMATANSEGVDASTIASRVVAAKIAADRSIVLNQELLTNSPGEGLTSNGSLDLKRSPFTLPPLPSETLSGIGRRDKDPLDPRPEN